MRFRLQNCRKNRVRKARRLKDRVEFTRFQDSNYTESCKHARKIKNYTRNSNFKPKMYFSRDKYYYGVTNEICTLYNTDKHHKEMVFYNKIRLNRKKSILVRQLM